MDLMRVVVLGGSGNVGTSVMRLLAEDSRVESVLGVARRRPQWSPPKADWVEADVRYDDLEAVLDGADAVIHLAWMFQPSHHPEVTWHANVVGTSRLLEAVARTRVPRLVVASSVGAYSPGPKAEPVDESWPTHGWSPAAYCREKAYLERMLENFERTAPSTRVAWLRPCFLFKKEAAPEQRRIFGGPLLPERVTGLVRLPLLPDMEGLAFQAMHTDDAARAYVAALHNDAARGPYNVAADPVVNGEVLADVLGGKRIRVPVAPVRGLLSAAWKLHAVPAAPELFDYVLKMPLIDTTRARTELGWEPTHSSRAALEAFRAGLRDGAGFPTPPLQPSRRRLRSASKPSRRAPA